MVLLGVFLANAHCIRNADLGDKLDYKGGANSENGC